MAHSGATGLVDDWRTRVAPPPSVIWPPTPLSQPPTTPSQSSTAPSRSSSSSWTMASTPTPSHPNVRHPSTTFHTLTITQVEGVILPTYTVPGIVDGVEGLPRDQGPASPSSPEFPQRIHPLRHQARRKLGITLGQPGSQLTSVNVASRLSDVPCAPFSLLRSLSPSTLRPVCEV